MPKKQVLIKFPREAYDKIRAYTDSHGSNLTQLIIQSSTMYVDAVLRTEAEQAALLGE